MQFDVDATVKVVSPILTGGFAFLLKRLEHRPRLVSYLVHTSSHPIGVPNESNGTQQDGEHEGEGEQAKENVNSPPRAANTHGVLIRNIGKKTAFNIRVGHGHLPYSYSVYPPVNFRVERSENGAAELIFPTLVPNEQIYISYLYFPPVLWNIVSMYIKSDDGLAQEVTFKPEPPPSIAMRYGRNAAAFLGVTTAIYWIATVLLLTFAFTTASLRA